MRWRGHRRNALAVVGAVTAVSTSLAGAGRSAGPAAPTRTADPCRPAPTALCLAGADGRAAKTTAAAASFTFSSAELAGLGLPSLQAVAGSRATAVGAALDRQLVAALMGPVSRARSLASTSDSPSDVVGATFDSSQSTGSSPRLVRSVHLHVQSDLCPKMRKAEDADGHIRLVLGGSITMVGLWRSGRTLIQRSVTVALPDLPDVEGTGYVDSDATYGGYYFPQIRLEVRLQQQIRAPGAKPAVQESEGILDANPAPNNDWKVVPGGTFEAFIEQQLAKDRGDPPPDSLDVSAAQIGEAFQGVGHTLMTMLEAQLQRVVAQAQSQGWQKPNECAKIEWNPTSGAKVLAPTHTMRLAGRITALRGGPDGYSSWPTDPRQDVGELVQALTASSRGDRPMAFSVMGTGPVDNLSVRFDWQTPSTVGIAESEWTAQWKNLPRAWHAHFTADFVTTPPEIESNLTGDVTADQLWLTKYQHVTGSVTWTPTSPGCSGSFTGDVFDSQSLVEFSDYPEETMDFSFDPTNWHGSAQCTIDGAPMDESPPDYVVEGVVTAQSFATMSGTQTTHQIPFTETAHWQFTAQQ